MTNPLLPLSCPHKHGYPINDDDARTMPWNAKTVNSNNANFIANTVYAISESRHMHTVGVRLTTKTNITVYATCGYRRSALARIGTTKWPRHPGRSRPSKARARRGQGLRAVSGTWRSSPKAWRGSSGTMMPVRFLSACRVRIERMKN